MNQLSFEFVENFVDDGIKLNKLGKFKTKKCARCKIEKEATYENFLKDKRNKDKLSSWCRACASKSNNKINKLLRDNRKEKGICDRCNEKALSNRRFCTYHTVDSLIKMGKKLGRFKQLKTKEDKRTFILTLLQKLEYQNYKCAITGVDIALGDNAHLDHIKEICNGGSCELDNLQWVSATANLSKPRKYKEESELINA